MAAAEYRSCARTAVKVSDFLTYRRSHVSNRDMTATIQDAIAFAKDRHQTQKYADQPYEFHLARVAQKLSMYGFTDAIFQIAAWLHDTIEDTDTTLAEIRERFGYDVNALVWCVTGVGENRKIRNQSIAEKLFLFPLACPLKAADRLVNHETSICDPGKHGEPSLKHILMYLNERTKFEGMVKDHIPPAMWEELQRQYARMEEIAKLN